MMKILPKKMYRYLGYLGVSESETEHPMVSSAGGLKNAKIPKVLITTWKESSV